MSDAMLSATQNLVQAFNNNTRAFIYNSGQYTSSTITSVNTIQIASGGNNSGSTANTTGNGSGSGVGGRIVSCSVVSGAVGSVKFYNSATTQVLETKNLLAVLENPSIGIHDIGKQFVAGLVMVIDGDLAANCTYSLG